MRDKCHFSYTAFRSLPVSSCLTAASSRRKFITSTSLVLIGLLVGSALWYRRGWKAIVIHHSAGNFGNVAFLDKVHRERQPYDPIDSMAYHFVIGNGNGMPEGKVDYGFRWQNRLWGTHVSAANSIYNLKGIGICLIGNYHREPVPTAQYKALIGLIRQLISTYKIRKGNIYPHCKLNGERTVCPGRYFPYDRLYHDIA